MAQIGDEVVVMSARGRFKVIAVEDEVVTVQDAQGVRKTFLKRSVRVVEPRKPAA